MIPVRDPAALRLMLRGMPGVDEIVVVDIDSALPEQPGAILVRPGSAGAGNALASGVGVARGDVVVTLNGDGSTDPAEIPRFVAALVGGADVALGSRYSAGGRDLTGGRFRRWANLLLIWCLNTLLGTHRTDPGFGYAAFWRDTVPDLGLPDPSPGATAGADAAWGAGPEVGPLLALRPAVRGLRVAEVASVAFPPIRRALRSDRPRLHHWLRTALRERKTGGRHATGAPRPLVPRSLPAVHELDRGPLAPRSLPVLNQQDRNQQDRRAGKTNEAGAGRRALDRRAVQALAAERQKSDHTRRLTVAKGWEQADRRTVRPLWASYGRGTAGAHQLPNAAPPVWRDGHPERLGGPDTQPRPDSAPWPDGGTTQPSFRPEIGSRRRRIAGIRQSQPDLRVINGEGAGAATGRRARLRSVKKPQI
ncbi:glycosyltransferase family 2 protein [Paractinoplanes hotanensis]|uniref:Glycosyltransferase family 2 protein n=1 Tax=Paractinoplanes hotanensis TaxID=2906497 RepID=A0ABT0XYQ9_9ACTN|nr:glycosyltransferase family 2 protein [Actinoplanes hotanensis]MCM4078914.1 glycosyltransferase family 2 protein [Actinoplanes hotanensis]